MITASYTRTACEAVAVSSDLARDQWLTLARVGDTHFSPPALVEGAPTRMVDPDATGESIAFSLHLGGESGTASHGMVLLAVDFDDEVLVYINDRREK